MTTFVDPVQPVIALKGLNINRIEKSHRLAPRLQCWSAKGGLVMTTKKSKGLALGLAAALVILSLSGAFAQTNAPKAKVNINTANQAELESLPRIGPKVAQRIIDYRAQNGNFKKIEDLMKVKGIGEKIFAQIKDLITVGQENQVK
jgi:competence protein ComEA